MPYSRKEPCEAMARVSKAPIVACLTCPLCGNLFREATTISECLHTFCKDCINDRFSDEETNSCPMCNVDLGTVPQEKLRADPQLDDVQAKIFNLNPKKRPAAPIPTSPPAQTPTRRKERSLSSLGVTSMPSSSRRKSRKRKAWVTESSESYDEEDEADDDDDDEQEENGNSSGAAEDSPGDAMYCSETLDSDTRSPVRTGSKRQRAATRNSGGGNSFLSPLACLAELAHADERGRSDSGLMKEARSREASSLRATKNVRRSSQAKANGGVKCQTTPSTSTQLGNGLWFSLTSTNQGDDGGLPQIKAPYLRIRDGKIPVSFVKKYLVRKLELKSESEVEITCKGQPVVSSLPLESVRKIWLAKDQVSVSEERAGAAGKDFLMVLSYGRNKRAAGSG